jgi:alkaline phosphatase
VEDQPAPEPRAARRSPPLLLGAGVSLAAAGVVLVLFGLVSLRAGAPGGSLAPSGLSAASGRVPASLPSTPSASPPTPSPTPTPTPTPAPPDPVLVGAGDIASCALPGDEATAKLIERIPGIVFTLGDNAYESGTAREFRECYDPTWGRFLDRTRFAVIGNHDYLTDDGAPFRAYFGSAGSRDGATWFSEDVGTWHVIVLDANCAQLKGGCGPGTAQLEWLRADLAASDARCTLALWHQPRFSSGFHGSDPSVAPFWDALYAAGADLVLNGHEHDYERFAPQDPAGRADPKRGITEIVVGTGGATLRSFGPGIANDVVRSSLVHGVLVVTLKPAGWSFRFVSTDGSFSDAGQGACH